MLSDLASAGADSRLHSRTAICSSSAARLQLVLRQSLLQAHPLVGGDYNRSHAHISQFRHLRQVKRVFSNRNEHFPFRYRGIYYHSCASTLRGNHATALCVLQWILIAVINTPLLYVYDVGYEMSKGTTTCELLCYDFHWPHIHFGNTVTHTGSAKVTMNDSMPIFKHYFLTASVATGLDDVILLVAVLRASLLRGTYDAQGRE